MKPLKFSLRVPEMPDFAPRRNLGDNKLTPEQRELADILSVLEQKLEWYGEMAVNAYNLCALQAKVLTVLCIILLAIEGPRVVQVVLHLVGVKEQAVVEQVQTNL